MLPVSGAHTLLLIVAQARPCEGPRDSGDREVADAGTVLIAVRDAVLADSLRFSLELEGYAPKLCDLPFNPVKSIEPHACCLLLDQDVFATLIGRGDGAALGRLGVPTVLMVNQRTQRLLEHAKAAGVTSIVEKPLLGGVLFETIRKVLEADGALRKD